MSSTFTWATVAGNSPLRIRLDGDSVQLPFAPDSLVDPAQLLPGDRVRCELVSNRVIIHGMAGGDSARLAFAYLPAGELRYTAGNTFAKASYPWLRAIRVRVVGGGGSGGGAWASGAAPNVSFGYGGGGGGYAESFITDIAGLPASVPVTVGAGGIGTVGTAAGTSGGASSFGTLVAATGGVFGWSKPNSVFGAYMTSPLGGDGTAGDIRISGSVGGRGNEAGQGLASSGEGGDSQMGGGARGWGLSSSPLTSPGATAVGLGYGGGGGGAVSSSGGAANTGGAGAPGIVIVELFA